MEINKENQNKKRLGRGIGSLLGGVAAEYSNEEQSVATNIHKNSDGRVTSQKDAPGSSPADDNKKVWNIAIDKLVPGMYQPRKKFEKTSLEELAQSIKENGILQPIIIRKRAAGGYEIIAGERRWRAAQIAGKHEVPAIIRELTDRDALQLALIENIQREDLDPIEEGESYQRLMQEFSYSQAQVAEKVGKERSTVANAIRLVSLPNEIKDMLSDKFISAGHAKVLLAVSEKAEQIRLAKATAEKGWSVRALEAQLKTQNEAPVGASASAPGKANPLNSDLSQRLAAELSEQLQKSLGTKVEINYKAGRGDMRIYFYSDDQLNSLYEKVSK